MKRILIVIVIVINGIINISGGLQAQAVDFISIEIPRVLTIYNKYEQQVDFQALQQFRPYLPLEIVEENTFLSDNFTPATKIRLGCEQYYLVREGEGDESNFRRHQDAGNIRIFRNCRLLGDTVMVQRDRRIFLSSLPGSNQDRQPLGSGTLMIRRFRYRGAIFCESPDGQYYGWSNLHRRTENLDYIPYRPENSASAQLSDSQVKAIEHEIDQLNALFSKLYSHFNRQNDRQKPAPRWVLRSSGDELRCLLENSRNDEHFQNSTRYLVNSLENILLSSAFTVIRQDAEILIRKK